MKNEPAMHSRAWAVLCLSIPLAVTLVGCGGGSASPSPPGQRPPSIIAHPSSQRVAPGQPATFSAAPTGSDPLTYQWQKNGTPITDATSASYTTLPATPTDDGSLFLVVVRNPAGSAISNPATLTVSAGSAAPSITQPPANQPGTAGNTAIFSVVATGSDPLAFQWQRNGTAITGATSAGYTTPAPALSDNAAKFRVLVSNSAGNAASDEATLTVNGVAASTIDVVTYHNDNTR